MIQPCETPSVRTQPYKCCRRRRPLRHLFAISTILIVSASIATAFVPQSPRGRITPRTTTTTTTTTTTDTATTTALSAKIPSIDEWEVLRSGAVKGTISNHPTLPNGYEITTSPLKENSILKDNTVVTTLSGSKYRLMKGLPPKELKRPTLNLFGSNSNFNSKQQGSKQSPPSAKATATAKPAAKPAAAKAKAKPPAKSDKPVVKYNLNGKVVGSGKDVYLLEGNLIRSSSRRSQIYYAYKADTNGNPSGPKLTVKLTSSLERLSRENQNYNRVFSKGRVLFALQGSGSCYVKKVGFVPECDDSSSTKGIPKGQSALILQAGDENLRSYLTQSKRGLSGSALRRAAVSVSRCVEAMHSSGLVWTDLKAENFVLIQNGGGDDALDVKGIDLESAVPVRSTPEDYSPEASPPEFALAEKQKVGYEFEVVKNYDTWSLGMLFFELATGRNYFAGKSENAILDLLANVDRIVDDVKAPGSVRGLEAIQDDRFRDLVKSCLSINPKKRPSIEQILLHPYFLTSGIGPLSF